MANTVSRQVIMGSNASERRYIVVWKAVCDTAAEITDSIVNSTTGDLGTAPTLISVKGALSGFSAQLEWDASTDVYALQIPSDHPVDYDFSHFGGIRCNGGSGVTGDLLLTTLGVGNGDSGSLVFEFIKG